jgi:hypothetical protein
MNERMLQPEGLPPEEQTIEEQDINENPERNLALARIGREEFEMGADMANDVVRVVVKRVEDPTKLPKDVIDQPMTSPDSQIVQTNLERESSWLTKKLHNLKAAVILLGVGTMAASQGGCKAQDVESFAQRTGDAFGQAIEDANRNARTQAGYRANQADYIYRYDAGAAVVLDGKGKPRAIVKSRETQAGGYKQRYGNK